MATTIADKPNPDNPIPPANSDKETLDLFPPPSTVKPGVDHSSINNTDATSTQDRTASDSVHATDISDRAKTSLASVGSAAGNDVSLASVEKKMRRAERFGINVQLTEQEKRNSRAERFGTGSPKSEKSKASEESKKQARAERFGVPAQSVVADGDAKKKARLARFAPASQTDPLEEEKRKARAIRFLNPESESISQVNGMGITEAEVATEDEAGGGA